MQRITVSSLRLVGLVGLVGLAAQAGCLADTGDGAILLLRNIHPDTMCVGTGLATEASESSGALDLLVPSDYLFFAQMKSRITALTGQEDQRTIITTDAKIDIAFPGSTVFSASELAQFKTDGLTHFKSLFSQVIAPGGTSDAGFTLIPQALVRQIAAKGMTSSATFRIDAVATFSVEGQMAGSTVSSQTFTYPVTLGFGRVINSLGTCPLPKGTAAPRVGYSCNPYQDGIVDCCTTGTSYVCPATISQ
jgi:hypothetical protein